ncbi:MAG: IS1595 family transposase [Rhizomicrobium sp.]
MSRSTISTFELFQRFPDEAAARAYIEARRWPSGAKCPECREASRITARKNGFYRCNACKTDFTVRTGTVFERSHVPLHKWLYAMYMLVTARKGISSVQLAKQIGVTQKTAWFVLGRLREACGNDLTMLRGIVEVDETYVGGKEKNRHQHKKLGANGAGGKVAVIGIRERGGRMKALPVGKTTAFALQRAIRNNIEVGSTIHTDEFSSYIGLRPDYKHETVNHSANEYVRDGVTTNGVESAWAVLKRGIYGVYHHTSAKHLHRYVDEFAFRLNDGDVKRHTMDRLDSLFDAAVGKRLTYEELIF